jgi:Phage stabilisation protein
MGDPIRISLAIPNESRDETRAKDSWGKNCFLEKDPTDLRVVSRPGTAALTGTPGALGSGVWNYKDLLYQIVSGHLYQAPLTLSFDAGTSLSFGTFIGPTFHTDGTVVGVVAYAGSSWHFFTATDGVAFSSVATVTGSLFGFPGVFFLTGGTPTLVSTDHGVTWGARATPGDSNTPILAYDGTNLYCMYVVGAVCYAAASTDMGLTWGTPYTFSFYSWSPYIQPAYFQGSLYNTNHSSGAVLKSSDGAHTWVDTGWYSTIGAEVAAFFSAQGKLWMLDSNAVAWSYDGTTLSQVGSIPVLTYEFNSLVVLGNSFLAYLKKQVGPMAVFQATGLTDLGTVVSSPFFDFLDIDPASGTQGFAFKSSTNAYQYNTGTSTLTHVTDADYPATTVPGLAFLDGTYYVMDALGRIWGSDLNNFLSWNALNVIEAQMEPDGGVAIARQLNFIVAFGGYSTEFFYDAGNPTGSPLLPYPSAMLALGCAQGHSVVQIANQLYFIGQSKQKGRGVYVLEGTAPKLLSTPSIERVLNADDLATVYSSGVRISGHDFYILTLGTTSITLVLDILTGDWKEWTSLTLGTPVIGKTGTYSNGQVSVASTAHSVTDGMILRISAGTDTAYNGDVVAMWVDADHFAYVPPSAPTATTNTLTYTPFTEGPFFGVNYTGFASWDVFQDVAGNLYTASPGYLDDCGNPVSVSIRTPTLDAGEATFKTQARGQIIGDTIASTLYSRYTDDDYQSWSGFRPISMNLLRKSLNRLGRFRRRAFELKHIAVKLLRLVAIELNVEKGSS